MDALSPNTSRTFQHHTELHENEVENNNHKCLGSDLSPTTPKLSDQGLLDASAQRTALKCSMTRHSSLLNPDRTDWPTYYAMGGQLPTFSLVY